METPEGRVPGDGRGRREAAKGRDHDTHKEYRRVITPATSRLWH